MSTSAKKIICDLARWVFCEFSDTCTGDGHCKADVSPGWKNPPKEKDNRPLLERWGNAGLI
jgi:hypothetical protein